MTHGKTTTSIHKGKHFFGTSFHFFWTWTLFMDLTTIPLEMTTLLLDLRTLLLDLRTLLLDLALPQTTPPWDRFSKLRLDRNSSDSTGLELRYHATRQEVFQYIVWFSASFPLLPSSQLVLFTPLPAFLSYAGAQLGVYLGESAPLGGIHLVSISKLPPLRLGSNFLHFLHSLSFNIYTSP